MKIDLNPLTKEDLININEKITLDSEIYKNTDIRSIINLTVKGFIDKEYNINIDVEGIMVLPDSRTLEDIEYPFTIKIEQKLEEIDKIFKNNSNKLDLTTLLWENIVLEIPIRVTKNEEEPIFLKGEGWELTDHKEIIDERMAPLKELLDKGKE